MKLSLEASDIQSIVSGLAESNANHNKKYPGDSSDRQQVHTVYGGAHLFKSTAAQKLGGIALRHIKEYAPNFVVFAKALGLEGSESLPDGQAEIESLQASLEAEGDAAKDSDYAGWLAYTVHKRVIHKLETEPIEDTRIDFEDGYGNRPDDEEDGHAINVAEQIAEGMENGTLPPFIGFRVKSFTEECRQRSVRTLGLVLTKLAELTGGKVPDNFVITLPKVNTPDQVNAFAKLLTVLEKKCGYAENSLKMEIMIETTQSIINHSGQINVPLLVDAGEGRCKSAAFGTYDYTAACNITAAYQLHTHSACDFARHVMQVALAGTGITICDGATTTMPITRHKAPKDGQLTEQQAEENKQIIHSAWKTHFDNIMHSLEHGYYQGWDLNPAQLPIRYAAVYSFFLHGLQDASKRLDAFLKKAAQATLVGNTFDDAATGQGLLNFFLRGIACGAITEAEALATGITIDELRSRSFVQIVAKRTRYGDTNIWIDQQSPL